MKNWFPKRHADDVTMTVSAGDETAETQLYQLPSAIKVKKRIKDLEENHSFCEIMSYYVGQTSHRGSCQPEESKLPLES